jgi:prepilin-type N-terminal cleavage/methylation domain-containing protein
MRTRQAARGFTLIELMVAAGLGAFVTAAAYGLFLTQSRLLQAQSAQMSMQESARVGLEFIARRAREASFGADPAFGIDMNLYRCGTGTGTATPTCTPARDGGSGGTDELVFYSRDKNYSFPGQAGAVPAGNVWSITAANATSGTLTVARRGTAAGDRYVFHRGQVLLAMCSGAATYTFVTVGTLATAPATAGGQALSLMATESANPTQRNDLLSSGCLVGGRAVPVDRHRFFIRHYAPAAAGVTVTSTTPGAVPYLVYDRGLDLTGGSGGAPDGAIDDKDLLVLAADAEDFQVAYLTLGNGSNGGEEVFGTEDVGFTALPAFSSPPGTIPCSTNPGGSYYDRIGLRRCGPGTTERSARTPANVVALRLTLVTRGQANPSIRGDAQPAVENHTTGLVTGDSRPRRRLSTTVSLTNMLSSGNFL